MRTTDFILLGLVLIIGFFMIGPATEVFMIDNETDLCYETYCSKTTLDEFDNCIDLGWESVGFLSSEHYYLCDGIKVTNTCTERSERRVYEGTILLNKRCECINDAECTKDEVKSDE